MLSCYRILDLTTEKAFIAGRALSDWGAEVIKIEPPGGDPARFKGAFINDKADPEKNINWMAFNANKKSVTLDITTDQGKLTFLKLVKTADAVLESYAPGYMDSIGFGYKDLTAVNPAIVLTSISGFGQNGPTAIIKTRHRRAAGRHGLYGRLRRPPSLTTSYEHTRRRAMNGAAGTMIACYSAPTPAKASTWTPLPSMRWTSSAPRKWKALTLIPEVVHAARAGAGKRYPIKTVAPSITPSLALQGRLYRPQPPA